MLVGTDEIVHEDIDNNDNELLIVMCDILDNLFEKLLQSNSNKAILLQSIKSNILNSNNSNNSMLESPSSSIKTTNSHDDEYSSLISSSSTSTMIHTVYEDEYLICTTLSSKINVINVSEKLLDHISELDIITLLEWICKLMFSNYQLLQTFWPKMHRKYLFI